MRFKPDGIIFNSPEAFRAINETRANVKKGNFYRVWARSSGDENTAYTVDKMVHAGKRRVLNGVFSEKAIRWVVFGFFPLEGLFGRINILLPPHTTPLILEYSPCFPNTDFETAWQGSSSPNTLIVGTIYYSQTTTAKSGHPLKICVI